MILGTPIINLLFAGGMMIFGSLIIIGIGYFIFYNLRTIYKIIKRIVK